MTSSSPTSSTRRSQRLENRTAISPPPNRKSGRLVTSPPQSQTPGLPPATRKSEKFVALTPKSPPVTRKSERLVKGDSLSSVRRSKRSKLEISSTPSGSKLVEEGSSLLKARKKKEKKEKSIQMLTMMKATEVISAEYEEEPIPICSKRRLDGHTYKASFKPQRTLETDSEEEVRIKEALQRIDQTAGAVNSSGISGDKENLGDEMCKGVAEDSRKDTQEGISEGSFPGSHSDLDASDASALRRNVDILSPRHQHGLSEGFRSGLDASALPSNVETVISSPRRDHDLSEKHLGTSPEGNIERLEISKGYKDYSNMQDLESPDLVAPSTSLDTEKHDFIANCFLCSKKRRLVYNSPEEELCCCTNARKGDSDDTSGVKSSKSPLVKLQRLPPGGLSTTGDTLLNNVNRLREFWHKKQNAVIIDETERMINVIYFIFSLSDVHKPFLVIATSDILAQWEAVFTRLKPSVHVVVYNADRGCMESIRSVEFHGEQGGKLFQVLLCPTNVAMKGSQILKHLKWEIIILDECQFLGPLNMLDADMRMILLRSSLKDVRDDYLRMLSLLDSSGDLCEADYSKVDHADSLVKLRDCFSKFIAYDCSFDSSRFVEYWLPAPISNLQLEQYCLTLLSGFSTLTSTNMKNNFVGEKIHEILLTVRKCCDHPYVVDRDVLVSRISQGYPSSDNVDFGMKASGKLHLLYKILSEIKGQKLRALVLFQSFDGAKESIGDMLEDLMRDRFGQDSYERIDHCVGHNKKQAALNRFGKEDSKQFVFLLENRACQSSIKLSIDIVVIFSSEWAPPNDIRTLQRISITTRSEKVPIFRLYSSFTVEEKALILGKQVQNLDNNLQTVNRGLTGNTLLMWGASSLFSRLEDYHASSSSASVEDVSFGHALLDDVVKDFLAILLDTGTSDSQRGSSISKAFRRDGIYHTDCPLFGEGKVQLTVGEESRLFWSKLLEGRYPRWKFSHVQMPRNRKRVSYAEGSSRKSEMVNDEAAKKRKKDNCVNAAGPHQPDLEEGEIGGSDEDALIAGATNQSQSQSLSDGKSSSRQNSMSQPRTRSPSIEQQSLHVFLKAEIAKLCKTLKLSEDVEQMVQRILEYLMKTRHVNKDDTHLLQAFQMSLCWVAADMLGQQMDRKVFFLEARKMLNFECPVELADTVYKKLMPMKKTFEQLPAKITDSVLGKNVVSPVGDTAVCSSTPKEPRVKAEVEYMSSLNPDLEQNQETKEKIAVAKNEKKLRKIQKNCKKRKLKIYRKHEQEIEEFEKIWKEKREKLEEEHKIELAVVSTIHSQGAMKMDKLRAADIKFLMLVKEHEHSKAVEHKLLKKKHEAEIEMENRKCENWLAEAEAVIRSGLSTIGNGITLGSECSDGTPTTRRVSGNSLPTIVASDAVLSHVPVNVENEVVDGLPKEEEPRIALVEMLNTAEQPEAAAFSSQNGKGFTIVEALIHSDQVVNEIPSTNINNASDSELLHNGAPDMENGCVDANAMNDQGNSMIPNKNPSYQVSPSGDRSVHSDLMPQEGPSDGGMESVFRIPDSNTADASDGGPSKTAATDGGPSKEHPGPFQNSATSSHSLGTTTELHGPGGMDSVVRIPDSNTTDATEGGPSKTSDATDGGPSKEHPGPSQNSAASSHALDNATELHEPGALRGHYTTLNISADAINSDDSPNPLVASQVVESAAELHEQAAPTEATGPQPSIEVIDSVRSRGVPDLSTVGGTDHESTRELFVSSRNLAPNQVAGNANVVSQSGCNLTTSEAVYHAHPDLPAAGGINPEPNGEHLVASQNPNQAVLQSGPNLAGVQGTRSLPMAHPRSALSTNGPLPVEPLQIELQKIDKEKEQVIKLLQENKLQLTSECEKEIEELAVQIRQKYAAKLWDTEAPILVKKTEIELKHNTILMHKRLAEAVRSKCLDFRPSGNFGVQPGAPSGFSQHTPLMPSSSSSRQPLVATTPASATQPASTHLIGNPLQSAHRHVAGSSSSQPAIVQQLAVNPPVQSTYHSPASIPNFPSRPLQIGTITPSISGGRVGGDLRAPAPHLQAFRPPSSVSAPNRCNVSNQWISANLPANSRPRLPHLSLPLPTQSPRSSPAAPAAPPHLAPVRISQSDSRISEVERGVRTGRQHPFAAELLSNQHNRPGGYQGNKSPSLPESVSNNGAVSVSTAQVVDTVQCTASSTSASDVVCLSDDDN